MAWCKFKDEFNDLPDLVRSLTRATISLSFMTDFCSQTKDKKKLIGTILSELTLKYTLSVQPTNALHWNSVASVQNERFTMRLK
jgi:hypothetical protein